LDVIATRSGRKRRGQLNHKWRGEEGKKDKKEEKFFSRSFEENHREENGFSNRQKSPTFNPPLTKSEEWLVPVTWPGRLLDHKAHTRKFPISEFPGDARHPGGPRKIFPLSLPRAARWLAPPG
jgi:hypothetical protein